MEPHSKCHKWGNELSASKSEEGTVEVTYPGVGSSALIPACATSLFSQSPGPLTEQALTLPVGNAISWLKPSSVLLCRW